jgi:hypothetical protein
MGRAHAGYGSTVTRAQRRKPPSWSRTCPVIQAASSLTSQATAVEDPLVVPENVPAPESRLSKTRVPVREAGGGHLARTALYSFEIYPLPGGPAPMPR